MYSSILIHSTTSSCSVFINTVIRFLRTVFYFGAVTSISVCITAQAFIKHISVSFLVQAKEAIGRVLCPGSRVRASSSR